MRGRGSYGRDATRSTIPLTTSPPPSLRPSPSAPPVPVPPDRQTTARLKPLVARRVIDSNFSLRRALCALSSGAGGRKFRLRWRHFQATRTYRCRRSATPLEILPSHRLAAPVCAPKQRPRKFIAARANNFIFYDQKHNYFHKITYLKKINNNSYPEKLRGGVTVITCSPFWTRPCLYRILQDYHAIEFCEVPIIYTYIVLMYIHIMPIP